MSARILIYTPVEPADRGGVQRVCEELARHLRARGHAVRLAWPRRDPARPADAAYALPELVWRGRLPAPRSLWMSTIALIRLAAALVAFRPTVVNVHFLTGAGRYFLLLRRLFRFRLVVSVHGSDVLRPQACDRPHLAPLLQHADAITAVSAVTQEGIAAHTGAIHRPVTVIPNGVDLGFWQQTDAGDDDHRRRPTILTVGRLDPVKGHDVLIRAFARVHAHCGAARLVIAGDGGYRPALERLIDAERLHGTVQILGSVTPSRVRTLLSSADVFALPSRSEGLPLALLEAMAAGVPSVASRVGGVPEVLVDGTGLLVPPEDPCRLADAIVRLLRDRPLREQVAASARQRVRVFAAGDAAAAYEHVLTGDSGGATAPAARTTS